MDTTSATIQPVSTIGSGILKAWLGHLLDSRASNIAASPTSTAQIQQQASVNVFPVTLFYNLHALQVLLPRIGIQWVSILTISKRWYWLTGVVPRASRYRTRYMPML